MSPSRIRCLPLIARTRLRASLVTPRGTARFDARSRDLGRPRLVFVGRMDRLKGGQMLLEALPLVKSALGRSLRLDFAGDGPVRQQWQEAARVLQSRSEGLEVVFHGRLMRNQLDTVLSQSDLLVVPSVWPEPFGLVGLQAASHGVPAVGFAVGGIPEWIEDGVNGHLAEATPPTAEKLAGAIAACLMDDGHYRDLSTGARDLASRSDWAGHVRGLLALFEEAAGRVAGATAVILEPFETSGTLAGLAAKNLEEG